MRTANSAKNIITSLGNSILNLLLGFISRTVFISVLGLVYLGVNGLFSNILTMLSLAEMGIGSAIIYSLYKPLAEKDEYKISAIMRLYRKAYIIIGFIIFILGLIILPFLDVFIKDKPDIGHLGFIYLLFLLNTALSYFFSYNRALITADQKAYKILPIEYIFKIALTVFQVTLLLLTKNFFLYLIIQICFTLFQNITIYYKVKKEYPVLKQKLNNKLEKEELKQITKNTSALMLYRIAIVVTAGTDNIVISSFLGLKWVGLVANYNLIITSIYNILSQVFSSVTSSVGNLSATESNQKKYEIFRITQFISFWLYGFSSICLFILIEPTIQVWLGEDYLLSRITLLALVVNFLMLGMQFSVSIFRDAQGLFWQGKFRPVAQAATNLIASIVLVKITNEISAVFWGTAISRVLTLFWYDPYVVHKHGFKMPLWKYFLDYLQYIMVILAAGTLCFYAASLCSGDGIVPLILKLIVCIIITNCVFFIVFFKTKRFKYVKNMITGFIKRFIKRGH